MRDGEKQGGLWKGEVEEIGQVQWWKNGEAYCMQV